MPWGIYTDLSGVAEVHDGPHATELEALQGLILHAESERSELAAKIAKAKARRRRITKRKT